MRLFKVYFVLMILIALSFYSVAAEVTVTCPISADATICSGYGGNTTAANTNYGGSGDRLHEHLQIGFDKANPNNSSYIWGYNYPLGYTSFLLKFDLSSVPSGVTITSAKIYLSQNGMVGSHSGITIECYKVTTNWNENSVTYNNKPSSQVYSTDNYPNTGFRKGYFEIGTLVQQWKNGSVPNFGVKIQRQGTSQDLLIYYDSRERNTGLTPYLQVTYNVISNPPALTYFAINNGAGSTTSRTVTLNNTCINNPTQYIASESSTLSGAAWKTYSEAPSFSLSSGNGTKRVYFKVKNSDGESTSTSDTINLNETLAPTVNSFSINNGASSTTSRTVTLNNICANSPTHYMSSESSNFSGAAWKTYSEAPSFSLSSGNGTKRVYFRVKNSAGESSSISDTISLNETQQPTVNTFSINNGASSTTSRTVTLNNICANSPTHYMSSESSSFSGAAWKTYSEAPSFSLSSGNGTKRVYFRVKNSAGESSSTSDTITLNEAQRPSITSLSINSGASSTSSRTVILNNSCTNSPSHYIASESSSFSDASWRTYSSAPTFLLSSGNGTKKVYFKVKNSVSESLATVNDSIYLDENSNPESLTVGVLVFYADNISKSGNTYNLSGNININEKLWFSGNVKYTSSNSTGGNLLSYGYPYIKLANGIKPLFTASDISYDVNGNSGTLTPKNLNHISDYALALVAIPIKLTSDPIKIKSDGVLIGGQVDIGSGNFQLCVVDVEVLYKPNDRAYLRYAQLSGDFSSTIPGIETASIDLNYDGNRDRLTGSAELDFPFLGLDGVNATIVVEHGCFNGFDISVGLKQGIPLGATGLSINGFTLEVDNICYPPEFYIFFGGDLGITGIPSDIFSLEKMGLGYQQPWRLNISAGTVKILDYPVASLSGYIDASNDKYRAGAGIYGTVNFGGFYMAEIDVKLLTKLKKFSGSAYGKLQIPDFTCDSPFSLCVIIKALIEYKVDLPYTLATQQMSIDISKDGVNWNGSLKGMVKIWNLSLATELEYSNKKLHFSIGKNYEDMIRIFRNSSLSVQGGSVEQSLVFPENRREVIFAAIGTSQVPEIYLKTPDGDTVTVDNVIQYGGIDYIQNPKSRVTLFFLDRIDAGQWTIGASNASASEVSLKVFSKRLLSVTSFSDVKKEGNKIKISAKISQATGDTKVGFYFSSRSSGGTGSPIAENLTTSNGSISTNWDISSISTGEYYIFARTTDNVNPPEITYYQSPIEINNSSIEAPSNLHGSTSGSRVELSWKSSSTSSVIGYKVLYTDEPDIGGYKYEKVSNEKDRATITGLKTSEAYRFCVVAFDKNGNFSPQSNMYSTKTTGTGPSTIQLSRNALHFGALLNSNTPNSQSIYISNSGSGALKWEGNTSDSWLLVSPNSGSGNGEITINVNQSGLSVGSYTGLISVTDSNATNSPQTISVDLNVYSSNQSSPPFGEFSTPVNGSTVSSSIPVTGWVLDDIGVTGVKIYSGNDYIGDAIFVEGARPDVENAYPNYPMNYKAGWGYMLLTNYLPNGGNGTYTLFAKATDTEGNQVTLGSKTIIVDNKNASKPFGAIDTPTQGGIASGNKFINWGWVLTPQPNRIQTNGSTIKVYVDGVNLGNPTYNIYREDIASFFPGYANSNGAVGYFYLDTTAYENGVHSIQWVATDTGGNTDGIGSRYFTIQNSGSSRSQYQSSADRSTMLLQNGELPLNEGPVNIGKGFGTRSRTAPTYPDKKGDTVFTIRELERVVITPEQGTTFVHGYSLVSEQPRRLPIGSSINDETGNFNWIPGPGFFGQHQLVLIVKDQNGNLSQKKITINILPKHQVED